MEKASFSKIEIWYPPEAEAQNSGSELVQQKVALLLGQWENAALQYTPIPGQEGAGAAPITSGSFPGIGIYYHSTFPREPAVVIPSKLLHPGSCPGKDKPLVVLSSTVVSLSWSWGSLRVCFHMMQFLPAHFGLSWRDRMVLSVLFPTPTMLLAPRLPPWAFLHLKHSKAEVITRIGDAVTLPCQQVIDLLKTLQCIHG